MKWSILFCLLLNIVCNGFSQKSLQQSTLPKIGPTFNATPKPEKIKAANKSYQNLCNDYNLGVKALFNQLETIRKLEKKVANGSAKLEELQTELVHWNRRYKKTEEQRKKLAKELDREKARNAKLTTANEQQRSQLTAMQASLDSIDAAFRKVCAELEVMKKENAALRLEVNTLQMRLNDAAKAAFQRGIRIYDQDYLDLEKVKSNGRPKKLRFEVDFTASKYSKIDMRKATWQIEINYKNGKKLTGTGELSVSEENNFYHVKGSIEFTGKKQLKKLTGLCTIIITDKREEYRNIKIIKMRS